MEALRRMVGEVKHQMVLMWSISRWNADGAPSVVSPRTRHELQISF